MKTTLQNTSSAKTILMVLAFFISTMMLYGGNITSFTPASGSVGTTVTITGTGFNTTAANNVVFFGATKASVSAATATNLTVTVPNGATYEYISVTDIITGLTGYSTKKFNATSNGGSNFTTNVSYDGGSSPYGPAVGDLDGDGKPDIVVANFGSGTVSVLLNTGSSGLPSFATAVTFATAGSTPRIGAIADIDGDGKPDLVVVNQGDAKVSVFRNTSTSGSISFAARADYTTATTPIAVAIGDLDGDGRPDLAIANFGSSSISVLRNIGSAGTISFATKVDYTTGASPAHVVIGDLDGDGKPDLAACNNGSNNVSTLLNTSSIGSLSFATHVTYTIGTTPLGMAIGDLDGDGKLDLAVANSGSSNVSVLLNTGSSGTISFAAKEDYAVGNQPVKIAMGDVDGDGKPELATCNSSGSNASLLRNKSTSGSLFFATKEDYATAASGQGISITDMDGDGKSDMVVAATSVLLFRTVNTAPSGLSYASITTYQTADLPAVKPTVTGAVTNYSVSPALPAGLVLNATTGTISGSPTTVAVTANYTVTATNAYGNTTFAVSVTVNNPPAVTLTATTGTTKGGYNTLKTAFDAINLGTHTGIIAIKINGNTTETASAVLNASGGTASYTSVNIYPTTTGVSISGNLATPLIDLNGADYVTIDGRVDATGTPKSLTVVNSNVSTTAETSNIRFTNTATNNTVKYCVLKSSMGANSNSGCIYMASTGTNNFLTIDNNDITNANGVRALSSAINIANSSSTNITISNNNIYDYVSYTHGSTFNIIFAQGSTTTVSYNSIYETLTQTTTFKPTVCAIYAYNLAAVKNNYIGGSGPNCSGTWTVNGLGMSFQAIFSYGSSTFTTSIQGNTIKNIDITSSDYTYWYGIRIYGYGQNVGTETGNIIGSATGNGSIKVKNGVDYGKVYGIYVDNISGNNIYIHNNTIGGITTDNSNTTYSTSLYGIYIDANPPLISIKNNSIGSTDPGTSNSLYAKSTSTTRAQDAYGICVIANQSQDISGNTVSKVTNAGTTYNSNMYTYGIGSKTNSGNPNSTGTVGIINNTVKDISSATNYGGMYYDPSLCGISLYNSKGAVNILSKNRVSGIKHTIPAFSGYISGIFHYGHLTVESMVSDNFLTDVTVATGNTSAWVFGLNIGSGSTKCVNNIVSLDFNTNNTFVGLATLASTGTSSKIWHNTVYMSGASTGTSSSYAFYPLTSPSGSNNIRNNVFYNAHTRPASKNYAAFFPDYNGQTVNYNDYYAPNTGGVLGYVSGDKNALPLYSGWDANSLSINPVITAGATDQGYVPSASLPGVAIPECSTDFYGTTRSATTPKMGAWESTPSAGNTVEVYIGASLQASYLNLTSAFDAINAGTHTGSLIIKITASQILQSTAVLNASGTGSSNYTDITIFPTSAGLTISGNIIGSPLINLNGADNVIIDGRINATGSVKNLTLANSSSVNYAGISTLLFINDASNNTVQYCIVTGSAPDANGGVIFFSTGTTTGNNNNTITYSNLTNAANGYRPVSMLYSKGTSATVMNSNNTVSNNNFYNFQSASVSSYGIHLRDFTSAWTITANSFYETASFTQTGGAIYCRPIYINNADGVNFVVSGNFIGGSLPECGGSAWTKTVTGSLSLDAIYIAAKTDVTSVHEVQGNTIKNINWLNSIEGNATILTLNNAKFNVGNVVGNTIGNATGNGSITITWAGGSTSFFTGIKYNSSFDSKIENNSIGSITINHPAVNGNTSFSGIELNGTNVNVTNNVIGSTDAGTMNSIFLNTNVPNSGQRAYGILRQGSGTMSITNNTVAKMTHITGVTATTLFNVLNGIYISTGINTIANNTISDLTTDNTNAGITYQASVAGIVLNNASANLQNIKGNHIYNLSNTYSGFAGTVSGIYYSGGTTASLVSKNFIHNLSVHATNTAKVYGLNIQAGAATYSNNIISLGDNTPTTLYGIYENGVASNNNSLYFNTVYLGGAPASGAYPSYALYSNLFSNIRDFRNNVFSNTRTNNGATGSHYAVYFNHATNINLTLNNNDYYAPGTGGVLGYYNATPVSALPLIAGSDAGSLAVDPVFASAGGTVATNYATAAALAGTVGTGVTDYLGNGRSATAPKMGAFEAATLLASSNTVDVYASSVFQASYTNLKTAFDAINAGTHTGALTLKLTDSEVLTTSAVLNASGTNSANYSSINIYPVAEGISILGEVDGAMIDLNGVDNLTIDGRVNGTGTTKSLVIANAMAIGTGISTIRFINDASTNTLKYCTLKGCSPNSTAGTLVFSTGTTTGNNNNLIDNNNITGYSNTLRSTNSVYSLGTSTTVANSNNTLSSNNVYDFLQVASSVNSYGILLGSFSTAWTITGNSFYETANFTPSGTGQLHCININSTLGTNFTISNNYIGGSAPECGGSAWVKSTGSNVFYAINATVGAGTASNIQGNIISNINWTNTGTGLICGINTANGDVNIGTVTGNTIGAATGNGAISFTNGPGSNTSFGIIIGTIAAATANVQNNIVGAMTLNTINSANSQNFIGIQVGGAGTSNVSNNTIGSTDAGTTNSIYCTSLSTTNAQTMTGIKALNGANLATIQNNIISKLTNATTNSTPATVGYLKGISQEGAGNSSILGNTISDLTIACANQNNTYAASALGIAVYISAKTTYQNTVSGNTIKNISNTSATVTGNVMGIYMDGGTIGNTVSGNFITGLSAVSATSSTAGVYGIKLDAGVTTCYNNIVSLSGNANPIVYGIYDAGTINNNTNLFFNTVYLSGTVTGPSYALYSNASANIRDIKNNILYNVRSSSTSYATFLNYAVTTGLTMNYNDLYVTLTNIGGRFNGLDYTTLTAWRTATSNRDFNSLSVDPTFANGGGNLATDYKPTTLLNGLTGTGITTDYEGKTRTATPTMGAIDVIFNTWTGTTSTDWNTATNWGAGTVPNGSTDVLIPNVTNKPIIGNGNTGTSGSVSINASSSLTVNGTLQVSQGIVNNGTFTATGGTVEFNGSTAQTIPALNYGNLLSSNTGDRTLASSGTISIAGTFTPGTNAYTTTGSTVAFNGSTSQTIPAFNYNNLTSSSTGARTLASSGTIGIAGTFTPGTNSYTTTGSTMAFNGSSAQTVPAFTFNNLTLNNAAGATLGGASKVNTTLTLSNGILKLGTYDLTLGENATAIAGTLSATNMIVPDGAGILKKEFSGTSSYTFPIGDVTSTAEYAPVTLNFTSGTFASAYAGVTVTNAKHANNASTANYLNRYWAISSSGISSFVCDVSANYVAADIVGTESSLVGAGYNAALPWVKYSALSANTLTASGVTSFPAAFTGINVPTVTIAASPSLTVCQNTSLTLTANPVGATPFTYLWTGGGTNQTLSATTTTDGSTDYTVTVTDANGMTANATTTVVVNAAPTITLGTISSVSRTATSFNIPYTATTGSPTTYSITAGTPALSGFVPVVNAALPASPISVTIPASEVGNYGFVLTVKNSGGCTSSNVSINLVVVDPPTALSYTTPQAYNKNTAITPLSPTVTGTVDSYSVDTPLPDGLSLNSTTGVISGTPTAITAAADYTITATNTGGSTTKVINITVNDELFAVSFAAPTHGTLTVKNGATTLASGDLILKGTDLTVTVTPDAGYVLSSFKANGSDIVSNSVTVTSTTTIVATFIVPVWTGAVSTDWNNSANWTPNVVPTSAVDIVVGSTTNAPTVGDNSVCNNLTVNTGGVITIPAGKSLTVTGSITNSAGAAGIVIKSDAVLPTGTLIYHNAQNAPVQASVEMYSKASWNLTNATGNKYKWQFFGVPVTLVASPTLDGALVRRYDESQVTNNWFALNASSTLDPFTGYEMVQEAAKKYSYTGDLVNADYTGTLTKTSGAVNAGNHLFANPYTAAIDITKLNFGIQTDATVYLYNTGTVNEWATYSGSTDGANPGQYTAAPKATAGTAGIPAQVPSMQGFVVKALSNDANATFGIPYSAVVVKNVEQQRVKSTDTSSDKVYTIVDVVGTTGGDRMWLFTDASCSHSFDNGWDGRKMLGSALVPQLYASEADGDYQVNSVNDVNNTNLAFQTGTDSNYKLRFTHNNVQAVYDKLYLLDKVTNTTTDITTSGTEYSFTASTDVTPTNRFKIVATIGSTTGVNTPTEEAKVTVFSSKNTIFVQNSTSDKGDLMLYDIAGRYLQKIPFDPSTITATPMGLAPGVYVAKAMINNKVMVTKNLIIQ